MKVILKIKKNSLEPSAYDFSIEFSNQMVPLPCIGERFYFYHYDEPMFMIVNDRTFELTGDGTNYIYEITLWGSYYMNVEGQRQEEI